MTTKLAVLQPFEVVLWGARKDVPLSRFGVQSFSEDEAKVEALRLYHRPSTEALPAVERVEVLSDVHLNLARRQQTLFEDLADKCIGHSMDDVQGACINLLLTAVQRRYLKQADAEARWNELMGRTLEALKRRYTGDTDRRDPAVATEIGKRLMS